MRSETARRTVRPARSLFLRGLAVAGWTTVTTITGCPDFRQQAPVKPVLEDAESLPNISEAEAENTEWEGDDATRPLPDP